MLSEISIVMCPVHTALQQSHLAQGQNSKKPCDALKMVSGLHVSAVYNLRVHSSRKALRNGCQLGM